MEKLIIILHCKHLIMCNYSVKMFASIHKKEYACRHVLYCMAGRRKCRGVFVVMLLFHLFAALSCIIATSVKERTVFRENVFFI